MVLHLLLNKEIATMFSRKHREGQDLLIHILTVDTGKLVLPVKMLKMCQIRIDSFDSV